MNKGKRNFISTGISSILMVFVVLCLITFAVLALTSANADYRLSEKVAGRTSAYYAAEGRAYDRLEEIDALLFEQYNNSENVKEYEENLFHALTDMDGMSVEKDSDGVCILFSEAIDDTEILEIELLAAYPQEKEDGFYSVKKWQSVSQEQWNPDMTLPVMQK